jgi:hypothetical protein
MTFILPFFKKRNPAVAVCYNKKRPLLFLHIPKSAGSSLADSIHDAINPNFPVIGGLDTILFGTYDSFSEFSPTEKTRIYIGENQLPAQADYVTGHFSYSHLAAVYPHGQVITIMREPSSRLISHWLFWRSQSDEELASLGSWGNVVKRARAPLHDFLKDPDIFCQTDNVAVRMLLSPHPRITLNAPIDSRDDIKLLRTAQDVLSCFSFVDVMENSQMSQRLEDWLGAPFKLSLRNVTKATPINFQSSLRRELDDETLALLETRTRLDRVLWHTIARRQQTGIASPSLERSAIMRSFSRAEKILAGYE